MGDNYFSDGLMEKKKHSHKLSKQDAFLCKSHKGGLKKMSPGQVFNP